MSEKPTSRWCVSYEKKSVREEQTRVLFHCRSSTLSVRTLDYIVKWRYYRQIPNGLITTANIQNIALVQI